MFLFALWSLVARADEAPLDPTSASGLVELVVKFGIAPVGFGAIVFWLVRYHIPSQQQTFKEVITGQQGTFKEALGTVIADHKEGIGRIEKALADEGVRNRESRDENTKALRATLTGMTARQLRAADDAAADEADAEPAVRNRRTTG